MENAGPFSTKEQDAVLARFFVETARKMNAAEPIPAGIAGAPDAASPETLALLLFAIKDWQLSDFANSAVLLEQFLKSEPAGTFSWIADYKPLAQKFLADYRVYSEWKKQPQQLETAEQIEGALVLLRATQARLQLKGRLNDAFKEEEAKLVRQLAEIQKAPP